MEPLTFSLAGTPWTMTFTQRPEDITIPAREVLGTPLTGFAVQTNGARPTAPDMRVGALAFATVTQGRGTATVLVPQSAEDIRTALAAVEDTPLAMIDAEPDIQALMVAGGPGPEWWGSFVNDGDGRRVLDATVLAKLIDSRDVADGGFLDRGKPLDSLVKQCFGAPELDLLATARARRENPSNAVDSLILAGFRAAAAQEVTQFLRLELMSNDSEAEDELIGLEGQVSAILRRMEFRGLLVDADQLEFVREEMETARNQAKIALLRAGISKPGDAVEVAQALTDMGESVPEKTANGNPKVDDDLLAAFADVDRRTGERMGIREPNPIAAATLTARTKSRELSTFVMPLDELRDSQNRVHPRLTGFAARTARMSISDPPLQGLPSKDGLIRSLIIADPGRVIISCDFSQIEVRVLAALSGEPKLTQAILDGTDVHSFVAGMVFGQGFSKAQRTLCKRVVFGKIYGAGAATIAKQTGVSEDVARDTIEKFNSAFPAIEAWSESLETRMKTRWQKTGWHGIGTPFGRRIPVDLTRAYAATNYVLQSTARDIFAEAMIDAAEAGFDLLLPIHDELLLQAPIEDAETVAKEIEALMSREIRGLNSPIPLPAEAEVYGPSWGDGYR